jgi:hypothetical protein
MTMRFIIHFWQVEFISAKSGLSLGIALPEIGRDKVPYFDVVKGRRGGPDPGKILQQAFHHAHAVHGARLNVLSQ